MGLRAGGWGWGLGAGAPTWGWGWAGAGVCWAGDSLGLAAGLGLNS